MSLKLLSCIIQKKIDLKYISDWKLGIFNDEIVMEEKKVLRERLGLDYSLIWNLSLYYYSISLNGLL